MRDAIQLLLLISSGQLWIPRQVAGSTLTTDKTCGATQFIKTTDHEWPLDIQTTNFNCFFLDLLLIVFPILSGNRNMVTRLALTTATIQTTTPKRLLDKQNDGRVIIKKFLQCFYLLLLLLLSVLLVVRPMI